MRSELEDDGEAVGAARGEVRAVRREGEPRHRRRAKPPPPAKTHERRGFKVALVEVEHAVGRAERDHERGGACRDARGWRGGGGHHARHLEARARVGAAHGTVLGAGDDVVTLAAACGVRQHGGAHDGRGVEGGDAVHGEHLVRIGHRFGRQLLRRVCDQVHLPVRRRREQPAVVGRHHERAQRAAPERNGPQRRLTIELLQEEPADGTIRASHGHVGAVGHEGPHRLVKAQHRARGLSPGEGCDRARLGAGVERAGAAPRMGVPHARVWMLGILLLELDLCAREQVCLVHKPQAPHEQLLGGERAHRAVTRGVEAESVTGHGEGSLGQQLDTRSTGKAPHEQCRGRKPAERRNLLARAKEGDGSELEDVVGAEDFAGHHARVRKDLDLRLQLALRVRKQASPRARGDERNTVAGAAAEPSRLIWIERCIAAAELETLTDDAHDLFRRLEGELLRRCPERRLSGETYGHENGAVASDSNNCLGLLVNSETGHEDQQPNLRF